MKQTLHILDIATSMVVVIVMLMVLMMSDDHGVVNKLAMGIMMVIMV